jgi:large subunit ribosomal protein L4
MSIKLLDKNGKKSSEELSFNSDLASMEANDHLLYLAVVMQQANLRKSSAKAKTRTEVRGGGRKPWRQKGTGRARAGSIRSPLFRGGGVIAGPTGNENYSKRLNKKASRKAIILAFLDKMHADQVFAIESLDIKEGKTKEAATILANADALNSKVVIMVDADAENLVLVKRAFKNIPNVNIMTENTINVRDLLNVNMVIATKSVINKVEERFAPLVTPKA